MQGREPEAGRASGKRAEHVGSAPSSGSRLRVGEDGTAGDGMRVARLVVIEGPGEALSEVLPQALEIDQLAGVHRAAPPLLQLRRQENHRLRQGAALAGAEPHALQGSALRQ